MSDFQKFLDERLPQVKIDNPDFITQLPDYDIYDEVRNLIITERKKQKITQKSLAQISGVSQANICNMENGLSKPSIDSLKKIADALGKRLIITFDDVRRDF